MAFRVISFVLFVRFTYFFRRFFFFFFNITATTEIYTLSLHDALPILRTVSRRRYRRSAAPSSTATRDFSARRASRRSEEHTSELQSLRHLVCRLLLEKKKKQP